MEMMRDGLLYGFGNIRIMSGCEDEFDVVRDGVGEPETRENRIVLTVNHLVNAFDDDDDFLLLFLRVANILPIDLVADGFKPIMKISSQLFFVQLYLLVDVEDVLCYGSVTLNFIIMR